MHFWRCRPHEHKKLADRKILQYKYYKKVETTELANSCQIAFRQSANGKEKTARAPTKSVKQEEGLALAIDFDKAIVKQKKDLKALLKKCEGLIVQVTKARSSCDKNVKDQLTEGMHHFTEVIDKTQIALDNTEKKDKVTEEDHQMVVSSLKDLEKGKTLFEQLVESLIGELPKGRRSKAEPVSEAVEEKHPQQVAEKAPLKK